MRRFSVHWASINHPRNSYVVQDNQEGKEVLVTLSRSEAVAKADELNGTHEEKMALGYGAELGEDVL